MELRRDLSLTSLTLTVVTGTIGSGWLFASYYAARTAGPASLPAWLLGGLISFMLALVSADDVHEAYLKKNEVNHKRQESGYSSKDENDSRHI